MKQSSREVWATGARLLVICAVAALVLGLLNEVTEPAIIARRAREQQEVIDSFITTGSAGAREAVEHEVARSVVPIQSGGKVLGYILELNAAGYGGDMIILASYDALGVILAARLMDNTETPGLGKKAESSEYMAMFQGTGGDKPVPVTKAMLGGGRPSGPESVPKQAGGVSEWFFGRPGGSQGGADAVSGATITFTGVSEALAAGSQFIKARSH